MNYDGKMSKTDKYCILAICNGKKISLFIIYCLDFIVCSELDWNISENCLQEVMSSQANYIATNQNKTVKVYIWGCKTCCVVS